MRNIILLIAYVIVVLSDVGFGATYGENVLAKLNSDIKDMNSLINRIQNHYREESFRNPDLIYPDNYGETLRRATDTIGKALRIIEQYEGTNQRLSDDYFDDGTFFSGRRPYFPNSFLRSDRRQEFNGLNRRASPRQQADVNAENDWKANFYKALSKALKNGFQDDQLIQEYVHDGFVPPTYLKKV